MPLNLALLGGLVPCKHARYSLYLPQNARRTLPRIFKALQPNVFCAFWCAKSSSELNSTVQISNIFLGFSHFVSNSKVEHRFNIISRPKVGHAPPFLRPHQQLRQLQRPEFRFRQIEPRVWSRRSAFLVLGGEHSCSQRFGQDCSCHS